MNDAAQVTASEDPHDARALTTGDRQVRRARLGVGLAFLLTGVVFATWAARIPAFKQELGLSDGHLALAFIGLNAGALLGLQVGGILVPRFGSRLVLRTALPLFALTLAPLAIAGNLALLTFILFGSAIANSVVDVGMNAHGVAIEQRSGRPLLSGLHAMHPLGGMVGAGVAALAAWLRLDVFAHLVFVAGVTGVAAVAATALLLPAALDADRGRRSGRRQRGAWRAWRDGWPRATLGFGVLAFCITLADGSALDWAAVYLRDNLDAGADLAAVGVSAFLAGTTLGRLLGDRLIERLGTAAAFRAGSLVGGIGFGSALLIGAPLAGVIGLMVLGAGISYLLPLLLSTAGGDREATSVAMTVTRVSTLGYLGSFVGPALIGALAAWSSLSVALAVPVALVLLAALLARRIIPVRSDDPAIQPGPLDK